MPHGIYPGGVGESDGAASRGDDGHFGDGGISAREPGLWAHGSRRRGKRLAEMSRSEEEMNATQDGCFEEAAVWHAKWQSASGLGLSAEEVDEWVRWSKDPGHKRAYDAGE